MNLEERKQFNSKALTVFLIIAFFPFGLFVLWKNKNFTTKSKGFISGSVLCLALIALLSGSPEGGKEANTSTPLTEAQKAALLNFEKRVLAAGKRADGEFALFTQAAQNISQGSDIYSLYEIGTRAQSECKNARNALYSLSAPKNLPSKTKKLINEAAEDLATAYGIKAGAFEAALRFLNDNKPGDFQQYKEELASSQNFTISAAVKLTGAKAEHGLLDQAASVNAPPKKIDLSRARPYKVISSDDTSFTGRSRVQWHITSDATDFESFAQTAIKAAQDLQAQTYAYVSSVYLETDQALVGQGYSLAIAHYAIDGGGFSGDQDWTWDVSAATKAPEKISMTVAELWSKYRRVYQTADGFTDEPKLRAAIAKELGVDVEVVHLPWVPTEKYPL